MATSATTQRALAEAVSPQKRSRSKRNRRGDSASHSASPIPTSTGDPLGPSAPKQAPIASLHSPISTARMNSSTSFGAQDFIPFDFGGNFEQGSSPSKRSEATDGRGPRGYKRSAEEMLEGDQTYAGSRSSRLTPWTHFVEWDDCINPAEMLHYEVLAFTDHVKASRTEHEVRGMVIELIAQSVQAKWPAAKVSPFGSYETGLYLPLGDLDLVIELPDMHSHITSVLQQLSSILQRDGIAKGIRVIANAKVPIVKFTSVFGNFLVDISINQSNGITAVHIIKSFIQYHPALKPLVFVIKAFLSQRSMNEVFSGGLGSYTIVCMALSFLQMHPKIRNGEIDPMRNLGVLVIEFFEFYGHTFNYDNVGISVRDGGNFYNKSRRGWKDGGHPWLLSMEDPQDEYNDISKGSYGMKRVRKTLAGAFEILTMAMLDRADAIMERSSRRHSKSTGGRSTSKTILGTIVEVTEEMIDHRENVRRLWKSGTLHRKLGRPEPETVPTVSREVKSSSDKRARSSRGRSASASAPVAAAGRRPSIAPPSPKVPDDLITENPSTASSQTLVQSSSQATPAHPLFSQDSIDSPRRPSPILEEGEEDESRYNIAKKPKLRQEKLDIEFVTDDDLSDVVAIAPPHKPSVPDVIDLTGSSDEESGDEKLPDYPEFIIIHDSKPSSPLPTQQEQNVSKPQSRSTSVAARRAYWASKSSSRSGSAERK